MNRTLNNKEEPPGIITDPLQKLFAKVDHLIYEGEFLEAVSSCQTFLKSSNCMNIQTKAQVLSKLAYVYQEQGNFLEADAIHDQAIKQVKQSRHSSSVQLADFFLNKGITLIRDRRCFEASQYIKMVEQLQSGSEQDQMRVQLCKLKQAECSLHFSDYKKAEKLLDEVMILYEKEKEPVLLSEIHLLYAQVYEKQGDALQGKEHLNKFIKNFENTNHRDLITAHNMMATMCMIDKNYDAAKKELEKAYELSKELYKGKCFIEVSRCLQAQTDYYFFLGQRAKAWELISEALQIIIKNYGPQHLEIPHIHRHIAYLYAQEGNTRSSVDSLESAMNFKTEFYGPIVAKTQVKDKFKLLQKLVS